MSIQVENRVGTSLFLRLRSGTGLFLDAGQTSDPIHETEIPDKALRLSREGKVSLHRVQEAMSSQPKTKIRSKTTAAPKKQAAEEPAPSTG